MPQYRVLQRHTYGRRQLNPGDIYEIPDQTHADVLLAVKFVERQDLPTPKPVQSSAEKAALRAQAEAAGVTVDGRWSEARLRQEIADAIGRQKRKDMQAQDRPTATLQRKDMQAEGQPGDLSRKAEDRNRG